MDELVFVTTAPEDTEAIGSAIGAALGAGAVVALDGELGAGKTCMIRGIAHGLGVTEPVTSPSFTLMHEYEGRLVVHHFDAWMTGREAAFLEGGGAEALSGEGVALVEWASRVEDYLPATRLEVLLEHRGPEARRITLRVAGSPTPDLEQALANAGEAFRNLETARNCADGDEPNADS